MRGSDVMKAIALGAQTVGQGRLPCLGLIGVTSLAELSPHYVAAATPVGLPGTLSAFPLLGEQRSD